MLALAAVMIVDPALMESPLWALVIFVGAILLAIAIHLVTVRVKERQGEAFIEAQSPDVAADAAQVSAGGAPPGDDPDATHAPPAP